MPDDQECAALFPDDAIYSHPVVSLLLGLFASTAVALEVTPVVHSGPTPFNSAEADTGKTSADRSISGELQMTKPQRRSAGVAVLRRIHGEWHCLLLRCYHYWDFPKGELNPGEDPLHAGRREVAEESGLQDLDFRWGEGYVETPPYAGGKVARYYLAESAEGEVVLGINPDLGRPEHQEYRWVPLRRADKLLNERLRTVLGWVREQVAD